MFTVEQTKVEVSKKINRSVQLLLGHILARHVFTLCSSLPSICLHHLIGLLRFGFLFIREIGSVALNNSSHYPQSSLMSFLFC